MLKIKDNRLIVKKEFRDKVKQILLDKGFDLFSNSLIKELIRCNCNTVELFYLFNDGLLGVEFNILNEGNLKISYDKTEYHTLAAFNFETCFLPEEYRFLFEYCEEV